MYKVFLVEDEIVVREGIRNNIPWDKTPYTLAGEAPDGEMALSLIQEIRPDILITDIRMPFMDGLTLSRIVKKNLPWIKIIILSGHDEFEYAREAISVGVEEYLLKPVSARDMLKTLDTVAKRLDEERAELLDIENLKAQVRSSADILRDKWRSDFVNGQMPQGRMHTADSSRISSGEGGFDPAGLVNIDDDLFLTKLKYAAQKDIEPIVRGYAAILEDSFGENPMPVYFLFGEILVAASKIVEALGADIKDITPFSLNRDDIQRIISSRDVFVEKVTALLGAVIEYRNSHTEGRYQSVIVRAREYIDQHFADRNISLYATASHVGISPNHLSAVFAQETGENFIEYLTRVRIGRARQLLKNTAMKSADIACETGFGDPHYFSYIFKKNTGLSPREFRKAESAENRKKNQ